MRECCLSERRLNKKMRKLDESVNIAFDSVLTFHTSAQVLVMVIFQGAHEYGGKVSRIDRKAVS